MANKEKPSSEILAAINSAPRPKNPAPSNADIQALRKLAKRGFEPAEILAIARKVYPTFDAKLLETNRKGRLVGTATKPA